jgi:hypothetical protein
MTLKATGHKVEQSTDAWSLNQHLLYKVHMVSVKVKRINHFSLFLLPFGRPRFRFSVWIIPYYLAFPVFTSALVSS